MADDPLVRVRIDLSYDGTEFSGWAAQPARRTVEGVLSETLGHVLRLPEPARLTVAGPHRLRGARAGPGGACRRPRRDAWATHADAALRRLSRALPPDIRVRAIAPARRGIRRPVFRPLAALRLPDLR